MDRNLFSNNKPLRRFHQIFKTIPTCFKVGYFASWSLFVRLFHVILCVRLTSCRLRSKIGVGWGTSSPPSPFLSLWVGIFHFFFCLRVDAIINRSLNVYIMPPLCCAVSRLYCHRLHGLGFGHIDHSQSLPVRNSGTYNLSHIYGHRQVFLNFLPLLFILFSHLCVCVNWQFYDLPAIRFLRTRWLRWDSSCLSTDSLDGSAQSVKASGSFVWYVRKQKKTFVTKYFIN